MTVITSRPEQESSEGLVLDFNELELISALMYITRLGMGSPYKHAAYTLLTKLTEEFGEDFLEESADNVDAHFSITDPQDDSTILYQFGGGQVVIEV